VVLVPCKGNMKTVLNKVNIDQLRNPMFFGEDLSLQRYDQIKYPKFYELYDQQLNFFWRPQEVSLVKDISDYKALSDEERFVFDSNLKFQTMTDSMLSRSIHELMKYVTNPELEICMNTWSFFETIHSNSYTYILNNVYPDATKFFNSVLEDREIVKRATAISEKYDKLLGYDGTKDPKQQLFDAVLSTQITEGLIFYVSFACSFYFGYRGKMEGNSKIIKFISRDENLHVAITQNIMKNWINNPDEGFQDLVKKNEDKVYEAYKIAVEAEKDWAEYLFSRGNLVGLTSDSLKHYIEWLANNRLSSLGYKKIYADAKTNPLAGWLDSYYDSKKLQVAPQETELSSYVKGVDSTISDSTFADFKL
jgi:ribonucleotide reductase beta subunit family protein with ferritin-like domain